MADGIMARAKKLAGEDDEHRPWAKYTRAAEKMGLQPVPEDELRITEEALREDQERKRQVAE